MVRRQDLSGFDDAERYDLRLQMRNRSRLRLFAGSCAIVSLVLVTYVTTEAWFVADWSGKGEGLSELDELSHMAGSSLKGLNTARDLISLKKHGREREELLAQVDRIEAIAQDGTPRASGKRPRRSAPRWRRSRCSSACTSWSSTPPGWTCSWSAVATAASGARCWEPR